MNVSQLKDLNRLSKIFRKKELTVAVAESCTSGLIQNTLSLTDNAMDFFHGGIVVYSIAQKTKHLNINPIIALKCNAVSKDICEKMALEVASNFTAEVGLAITGYAVPVPEENINTCFAYIAVSLNGVILKSSKITGNSGKNQYENQIIYTSKALKLLAEVILLQK